MFGGGILGFLRGGPERGCAVDGLEGPREPTSVTQVRIKKNEKRSRTI